MEKGTEDKKVIPKKLPQSYGIKQLNSIKHKVFEFTDEWLRVFGKPEKGDTIFVWGNSGNGKSTFCVMFAYMFSFLDKVLYVALEEKRGKSIRTKLNEVGFTEDNRNFQLLDTSTYNELVQRLHRKNSEEVIFIDSLQYWRITYREYQDLRRIFPKKTFVMVSHAQGKNPKGSVADSIHYDAGTKVWVEGGRIEVKHRYEGGGGQMVIIPELAEKYWNESGNTLDDDLMAVTWRFLIDNKLLPQFTPYVEKLGYSLGQFNRKMKK